MSAADTLTICFGETKDVKLGDRATAEECSAKLLARIQEFGAGVRQCVGHELPPARKAAYTSLAYNIGIDAFCKSTLVKKERAGNPAGAPKNARRSSILSRMLLEGMSTKRRTWKASS